MFIIIIIKQSRLFFLTNDQKKSLLLVGGYTALRDIRICLHIRDLPECHIRFHLICVVTDIIKCSKTMIDILSIHKLKLYTDPFLKLSSIFQLTNHATLYFFSSEEQQCSPSGTRSVDLILKKFCSNYYIIWFNNSEKYWDEKNLILNFTTLIVNGYTYACT